MWQTPRILHQTFKINPCLHFTEGVRDCIGKVVLVATQDLQRKLKKRIRIGAVKVLMVPIWPSALFVSPGHCSHPTPPETGVTYATSGRNIVTSKVVVLQVLLANYTNA